MMRLFFAFLSFAAVAFTSLQGVEQATVSKLTS